MKKNVFLMAGILLLSLLLLPGMMGCGVISSLMATPTPYSHIYPHANINANDNTFANIHSYSNPYSSS